MKWNAKGFTIYDEEAGLRVALVDNKSWPNERAEANAQLIEAAPAMYYLLRLISTLDENEKNDDKFREWMRDYLDRITKTKNA